MREIAGQAQLRWESVNTSPYNGMLFLHSCLGTGGKEPRRQIVGLAQD